MEGLPLDRLANTASSSPLSGVHKSPELGDAILQTIRKNYLSFYALKVAYFPVLGLLLSLCAK